MFSEKEISELSRLVNVQAAPSDILSTKEIEVVPRNLIKDNLFIPKSGRKNQTLILKKIFHPDLKLYDLVSKVLKIIRTPCEIRIGLSFIASQSYDNLIYFFAIRPRAINHDFRIINDKTDVENLVNFLKKFSYSDLLNHVFSINNSLNPFDKSGYSPRKLVLSVIWVTKEGTV